QLAHRITVTQAIESRTASRELVFLGQRDQRLGNPPQLLGLGQRGLDQLMLDQTGGHVAKHRLTMGRVAIEFTTCFTMTHRSLLSARCAPATAAASFPGGCPVTDRGSPAPS